MARKRRKAGRSRLFLVDRHSDGKPKASRKADRNEPLRIQRFRLGLSWEQSGDPLAATPLGIAYLKGYISEAEHRAGEELAAVVRRYWRLKGAPSPHCRASGSTPGKTAPDPTEEQGRAATAAYKLARGTLGTAARPILNLCAHDRHPRWLNRNGMPKPMDQVRIEEIQAGLRALADLYKVAA